jgi:DNA-binding transcriptional regulator YhcF (GntR family)
VRALAAELGLAVNTVARVYKELEGDGLVVTEGRRGTFVRSTSAGAAVDEAAAAYVAACRRQGLTRAEAIRLVEAGWSR